MIFPVKTEEKQAVVKTLKDFTSVQLNQALDLLQEGASHSDVKYAVSIPTHLVAELERKAKEIVTKVTPLIEKAKSVDDLKKVDVDIDEKDLIIDKMVKLSDTSKEGTLTTLKEAVGVSVSIEPEPIEKTK